MATVGSDRSSSVSTNSNLSRSSIDELDQISDSEAPKRQHSAPPITTITPVASPAKLAGAQGIFSTPFTLRCHPCDTNGPVSRISDAVKSRGNTPVCDPEFIDFPEKVHMLPEIDDWVDVTKWFPAEFVDFDLARTNREYQFTWTEGIVWSSQEPSDSTFYRSIAHWEGLNWKEWKLSEDQIGFVRVPECFRAVPEDADSFDPKLSEAFTVAVPFIAELLVSMDASNPVIQSYQTYFKEHQYNSQTALQWMHDRCLFDPSPALDAMLTAPLAALTEHDLLRSDTTANKKIWSLGSVFLQLLAVQHSLGEAWDLNGDTFSQIQAGLLVPSSTRALAALDSMWLSIDPISIRSQRQLTVSQFLKFSEEFKARHTIYDASTRLAFYHRIAEPDAALVPPATVPITQNGRTIRFAADLPSKIAIPLKRQFDGQDVFDGRQRKASKGTKKWEPKPTPPGVRRSGRNRARGV
ncbi:hypothetical protein B0H17DRAFT_1189636 [Mycena rosella]|uniref:Uncharacterized protein n=2 Tax=Mycena rosella TaxID=1033263 RepID=A0AAD7AZ14_MYCRO|nr:hypothetical protein B0H17DRAFT_1189636 [Mycena rosella]